MTSPRAALLLVVFAACSGGSDPRPAGGPNPDAVKISATCLAAMKSAGDVVGACKAIYREPSCQAAWSRLQADPGAPIEEIMATCRDAYCPRLDAPRPPACEHGGAPPPSEWEALQRAIWERELGVTIAGSLIDGMSTKHVAP